MRQKVKISVTVRLPLGLKAELNDIARSSDTTLTEVITTALEQWVRCYRVSEEEYESRTSPGRESMPVA
jgi:predicted transcriptional regulator